MKTLALKNNVTAAVMASALILGAGLMFMPKTINSAPTDPEITRYTNSLLASVRPAPQAVPQTLSSDYCKWYWNECAQIDQKDKYGFFGNDLFSEAIENVFYSYFVPVWNFAMKNEITRVGFLVFLSGLILAVGTVLGTKVFKKN